MAVAVFAILFLSECVCVLPSSDTILEIFAAKVCVLKHFTMFIS